MTPADGHRGPGTPVRPHIYTNCDATLVPPSRASFRMAAWPGPRAPRLSPSRPIGMPAAANPAERTGLADEHRPRLPGHGAGARPACTSPELTPSSPRAFTNPSRPFWQPPPALGASNTTMPPRCESDSTSRMPSLRTSARTRPGVPLTSRSSRAQPAHLLRAPREGAASDLSGDAGNRPGRGGQARVLQHRFQQRPIRRPVSCVRGLPMPPPARSKAQPEVDDGVADGTQGDAVAAGVAADQLERLIH